jgi:hypothetical protein
MKTEDAVKVVDALATTARWSGGDQPKLAVAFGMPLTEIWMWELEAGVPTAASFSSVQTVEEHCRWGIDVCSGILVADPTVIDMRWLQTDFALWIDHAQTSAFLADFEAALKPDAYSAGSCWQFCNLVLSSAPETQERLMPMISLMAHKALEKEPWYARLLVPQFYQTGHYDEAYEILKACPDTEFGSSSYNKTKDSYTVTGIGVDIWETIDDFHFACKTLRGDGSITARIDSLEHVHDWTKAGVMIRNSLDATSENAMVLVTPSRRVSFQYRLTKAAATYGTYTPTGTVRFPHWVRLTRRGNRFVGEHSPDGAHWQNVRSNSDPNQPSSTDIPMSETVYIGLAVTSHDPRAAEAQISNVTTTGAVSPSGPFHNCEDIRFQVAPSSEQAKRK